MSDLGPWLGPPQFPGLHSRLRAEQEARSCSRGQAAVRPPLESHPLISLAAEGSHFLHPRMPAPEGTAEVMEPNLIGWMGPVESWEEQMPVKGTQVAGRRGATWDQRGGPSAHPGLPPLLSVAPASSGSAGSRQGGPAPSDLSAVGGPFPVRAE